ncbi:MAG TPA: hypothetical protein VNL15_01760, partial [Dehalococcoidia bacterium]|nr:hypothetical protein [Dehalococcoidia bacterium]
LLTGRCIGVSFRSLRGLHFDVRLYTVLQEVAMARSTAAGLIAIVVAGLIIAAASLLVTPDLPPPPALASHSGDLDCSDFPNQAALPGWAFLAGSLQADRGCYIRP